MALGNIEEALFFVFVLESVCYLFSLRALHSRLEEIFASTPVERRPDVIKGRVPSIGSGGLLYNFVVRSRYKDVGDRRVELLAKVIRVLIPLIVLSLILLVRFGAR
jgi:hypothetical protein